MIDRGAAKKVAAALLTISAGGVTFLMGHEGTIQDAYLDPVGIPTICTGHTDGVIVGQRATFEQCRQYLTEDTGIAGRWVARCIDVPVTQSQYDALVSFTFNVGGSAMCKSTLIRKLNAGDCMGAAAQFDRWKYASGVVLPGLVRRRAEERAMFEQGCG